MDVIFVMVGRTDPSNSNSQNDDGGGLVYSRVCVHACVRECVRACVRACVHACMRALCACNTYNNILPRLIMIIIKIIFL